MMGKDFMDRLIELVKDDAELHAAAVRMAKAYAESMELANDAKRKKLAQQ